MTMYTLGALSYLRIWSPVPTEFCRREKIAYSARACSKVMSLVKCAPSTRMCFPMRPKSCFLFIDGILGPRWRRLQVTSVCPGHALPRREAPALDVKTTWKTERKTAGKKVGKRQEQNLYEEAGFTAEAPFDSCRNQLYSTGPGYSTS